MILYGNHTCTKCNSSNEWAYLVPQKLSNGNLVAPTLPKDKIYPRKNRRLSETEYEMSYRCPKCDELNKFTYVSDTYL